MNVLDLLYIPAAVVTAPWWARKTRGGWDERFGKIEALPARRAGVPRVLLHAVSVGEVGTLRELVPLLASQGVEVVVSASTDTGLKRAQEMYGAMAGVYTVRYPLDFSPAIDRFFEAVRPDAVALVELELWPNFVRACERRGVPVGVINGRLSARSFRGYARFKQLLGPTFRRLSFAYVQDEDYAGRFLAMGVPRERLSVTGSMKWDTIRLSSSEGAVSPEAESLGRELGIDRARPLVVAGSTAPVDSQRTEEGLLNVAIGANAQLLCATRKPENYARAFADLGGPGACVRRSTRMPARNGETRFLLDTIGELRHAYALADVCVIGRTFADLGGSDLIEPIALGKPTIVGPHVVNFASIVKTLEDAGALVRADETTIGPTIGALLSDPARCAELAHRGIECIRQQQGATKKHAEVILGVLAGLTKK
jgi:3-deoxy-D-manno-octulosonic-acid transferase